MYLDKAKVRQSFGAASATYDRVAALQRTAGKVLLDRIDLTGSNGTLIDLGCGTGFLTMGLASRSRQVVALDIAWPMLSVARAKQPNAANIAYLCADAERLPLASASADGVYSNLALQWCVDLAAVFADIRRILKPGGRFAFSIFGPQTLQELKAAWAAVDDYRHVNDFYSEAELGRFLRSAGFAEITSASRIYRPDYRSVRDLMQELKQIGAHNAIVGRKQRMTTKTEMQTMIAAYERHRNGDFVSATFEIITVTAN